MIAILIYTAIVLLYFHPLLSSRIAFVERDLAGFFIPPRYLWAHLVRSGELPLWNPHNYSGLPLLATLQPGICYPPHIFYLFVPFNIVWNWLIIFHFVFAGYTLYRFLRYLNASWTASLLGGIIFMLCGYLLSVHNLITHLFAVGWFPLVVMSFMQFFDTKQRRYLIYAAVFLSMEFLAGAPEMVFMTFLILFMLTVREIWLSGIHSRGYLAADLSPARFYAKAAHISMVAIKTLGLVAVLFLLISAVQLLPFIELKMNSIRRSGLSFQEATIWSFAWRDFILFVMPDAYGNISKFSFERYWSNQSWLKTMYVGIAPLLLAGYYFAGRNRFRITFGLIVILSFIFALGGSTPFYKVLHLFPPFNSLRYPIKFLFPFFFVVAVAAGLGLDTLVRGITQNERTARVFVSASFVLGLIFLVLWLCMNLFGQTVTDTFTSMKWVPERYNDISFNVHNLKRLLLFTGLFTAALFLYLRSTRKVIFMAAMVLIVTADLFLANYGFYYSLEWRKYIEPYAFAERIKANGGTGRYMITARTLRDFELVFSRPPLDKVAFAPPYAALYGAYTIDGSEVLRVEHHERFLRMLFSTPVLDDAKRMFDIAGIRYLITSYRPKDTDFNCPTKMALDGKDLFLCEYTAGPGRYLLFGRSIIVKNDEEAKAKLSDRSIDVRREVILDGRIGGPAVLDRDVKGNVDVVSYRPNTIRLTSRTDRPAYLYVSDTWYPGWRAYVDGKRTPIYRANLAFRAVAVPEGTHAVEFRYVPLSVYTGLILTLIGIVLCIWLCRMDREKRTVVPCGDGPSSGGEK